jgi:transcription elongation factor GreB
MSRAFVKEGDADLDAMPELPISEHPNYVTATGLAQLQARRDEIAERLQDVPDDAVDTRVQRAALDRDLRWVHARIASAQQAPDAPVDAQRVGFGALVDVVDADDQRHAYRIVGEDEADPEHGLVSWVSPLARALQGARVGDRVLWRRPAGDRELEVLAIRYD